MVAPLPVREYASEAEMRSSYLAIHRAMLAPRHVSPKPPLFRDQVRPLPAPDRDVTIAAAAEAHARFLAENRTDRLDKLKILQAARIVAAVSGVSVAEIKSDRQTQTIVKARRIALYLGARTGRTLYSVAYYLGDHDHTTARNARAKLVPIAKRLHLDRCRDAVEIAQRLWDADWDVVMGGLEEAADMVASS